MKYPFLSKNLEQYDFFGRNENPQEEIKMRIYTQK